MPSLIIPTERPSCPKHGPMAPRPGHTPEQRWCGDWYVCSDPQCMNAACVQSAALAKALGTEEAPDA